MNKRTILKPQTKIVESVEHQLRTVITEEQREVNKVRMVKKVVKKPVTKYTTRTITKTRMVKKAVLVENQVPVIAAPTGCGCY